MNKSTILSTYIDILISGVQEYQPEISRKNINAKYKEKSPYNEKNKNLSGVVFGYFHYTESKHGRLKIEKGIYFAMKYPMDRLVHYRLYPQRACSFRKILDSMLEKNSFLLWSYFQEEFIKSSETGSHQNAGGKLNERTVSN